jgi:mannose-6-phosphate isomerase-like protein (cupin superfamily)
VDTRDLTDFVHFSDDRIQRSTVFESAHLWCQLLCLAGTQTYGPVRDDDSDAVFSVLAGEAAFMVDGRRKRLGQWGSVLVSAGQEVTVRNASVDPLVVMLTAAPPPVGREVTG